MADYSYLKPTRNPSKFNAKAKKIFYENLALTGSIPLAAQAAGVSKSVVYNQKKVDKVLADGIEDAMDAYRSSIEAEIHRRAIVGVTEKQYYKGMPILEYELDENGDIIMDEKTGKPKIAGHAVIRKYSDTLLLAHARRHMPEYNEKIQSDVRVPGLTELLGQIKSSTGLPGEEEPNGG